MAKVLIIGSGGREHALALKFSQSQSVDQVFVAPGNPAMMLNNHQLETPIECVAMDSLDNSGLVEFALNQEIDLTFVGPETALANGVVDVFRDKGLKIVGPNQKAAQLESSKKFAKDLMTKAQVPTAHYGAFSSHELDKALAFLEQQSGGYVIKEDGLAAGKGVYILDNLEEARQTLRHVMQELGSNVVIEELMKGEELSYFALVNEDHIIPIAIAQDYKRAFDMDQGPNTGGMGAVSPVPGYHEQELMEEIDELVVRPLTKTMMAQGVPYTGVLYTGLMMTDQGPKVVEFNARFGDPETQVVLERVQDDFYELVLAHLNSEDFKLNLDPSYCMGVVLAAQGYPGKHSKGMEIKFSEKNNLNQLRFAGVGQTSSEDLVSQGGRILMVIGKGQDYKQIRNQVYQEIEALPIEETFFRKDIGIKFV